MTSLIFHMKLHFPFIMHIPLCILGGKDPANMYILLAICANYARRIAAS